MSTRSLAKPRSSALWFALLLAALLTRPSSVAAGDSCPTSADEIVTDRPDVTNSSPVVPYGSLQAENGVDWTVSHGSKALDGTNTRLRLGIAPCTEFLIDVPNYFFSINGPEGSGFADLVVSFKRQLPVPSVSNCRPLAASAFQAVQAGSRAMGMNLTYSFHGLTKLQKAGKRSACSR
jgi:hypothetical protein